MLTELLMGVAMFIVGFSLLLFFVAIRTSRTWDREMEQLSPPQQSEEKNEAAPVISHQSNSLHTLQPPTQALKDDPIL